MNRLILDSDTDIDSRVGAARQIVELIQETRGDIAADHAMRKEALGGLSAVRDFTIESRIDPMAGFTRHDAQTLQAKVAWLTRQLNGANLLNLQAPRTPGSGASPLI